jgi:DNA topoisomerase III
MSKLLNEGRTDLLPGFVSQRTRRPFKAYLVRGKDGKTSFEFEARKPKAGSKTAAAVSKEASPAPTAKKAARKAPAEKVVPPKRAAPKTATVKSTSSKKAPAKTVKTAAKKTAARKTTAKKTSSRKAG